MQAAHMKNPGRMLIGHPFNPPHLIPLVEVAPGKDTDSAAVDEAMAFFASLGKVPIQLRREIPGFVANRLQAALLRESIALVRDGVVTTAEIDQIVTQSVGLRWATAGPFESFHLGGGDTGFRGYLQHFGIGVQLLWLHSSIRPVILHSRLRALLLTQVDDALSDQPISDLERRRDRRQISVLSALAAAAHQEGGRQ